MNYSILDLKTLIFVKFYRNKENIFKTKVPETLWHNNLQKYTDKCLIEGIGLIKGIGEYGFYNDMCAYSKLCERNNKYCIGFQLFKIYANNNMNLNEHNIEIIFMSFNLNGKLINFDNKIYKLKNKEELLEMVKNYKTLSNNPLSIDISEYFPKQSTIKDSNCVIC